MKLVIRLALIPLLGIALSGCFDAARYNAERLSDLRARAAFELSCPESELRATPLRNGDGTMVNRAVVMSYGIDGCGRRSVYLLEPYTASWVANGTSGGDVAVQ